ncbi:MAG: L-threonylcarbamoyladenylate synthase [Chloroflexota bacterium]
MHRAIFILRRGGIVVFPTDTVYGLGADPRNEKAVVRIYEIKGRPSGMALPLLASGIRQASATVDMTVLGRRLARRFWPGALTLVLHRAPGFPCYVSADKDTVAVRVPRHSVPVALARGLGVPVIGTSANLSGWPSARTADEAIRQLAGLVDVIIDRGPCRGGIESTVVDATGDRPVIMRLGAISEEAVHSVLK